MTTKKSNEKIFARESSGLVKNFSSFDMLTFVLSFSLGSGILFFTVEIVGEYPGSIPIISLLIDLIPLFSAASVVYLLSLVLPKTGGQYVWISRILNPGLGYFINIVMWIGYCIIMGDVGYIGASFISSALTITAYVTHNLGIISLSKSFANPLADIIIAIVITVAFSLVSISGYKASKYAIYITFYLALLILIILDFNMLFSSSSQSSILWNHVFGGTSKSYGDIMSLSAAKGWTQKLIAPSLAASALASIPLVSSWSGFSHFSGWGVGEAKTPKRSMFMATFGAGLVGFTLMTLTIYSYIHFYGLPFISRLEYVSSSVGLTPSIPLLGAVSISNIYILAIIASFIIVVFPMKDVFPSIIFQSRQLVAAALDRLLPEKLLYINKKGQPMIAQLVTTIAIVISIIFVSPLLPLGVFVGSDLFTISLGLLQIFTSIAGILLPVKLPEVYKRAGKPINIEIGNIPLISILGVVSFSSWLFLLSESILGVLSSKVGLTVMPIVSAILGIVFLIYVGYIKKLQKEEGVDVSIIGAEIPPD
ncbi:hypothetical protein CM19_04290 [Candidatus Acidianus copahuensis]|uniref:Amino acid transporter n=1 Tax=Candidatus Acidianus copahuensis TaxID=1160895 RepID=A0A031LR97_9CREN|nr:amino acid permease [Candidatus Acidianus copahuensis]EZQ10270.1 hypothetical protein CM19_04290 [Candidatus Acidianus copahuensis]